MDEQDQGRENKMYTPAQRAAIAIVNTVPSGVVFGAQPVTCEDMLIGHVDTDYVAELTETAGEHAARPHLVFGERIRGGVKTGVLDSIVVLRDWDDRHVLEMAERTIELSIPASGEFLVINDGSDNVHIEMSMLDAAIASMLALKARACG